MVRVVLILAILFCGDHSGGLLACHSGPSQLGRFERYMKHLLFHCLLLFTRPVPAVILDLDCARRRLCRREHASHCSVRRRVSYFRSAHVAPEMVNEGSCSGCWWPLPMVHQGESCVPFAAMGLGPPPNPHQAVQGMSAPGSEQHTWGDLFSSFLPASAPLLAPGGSA